MQHLPIFAAHGDPLSSTLERGHISRRMEKGDGLFVLLHQHQRPLPRHQVLAHGLLGAAALGEGEGELVALELGILRPPS